MNKQGVSEGRRLGAFAKAEGNAAFAQKDRPVAVKGYTQAIKHLIDALSQRPDLNEKKDLENQLAICYANRAAAWLIEGEGMDAKKAVDDGVAAEETDPMYPKRCVISRFPGS
jgi:hypothetical protein